MVRCLASLAALTVAGIAGCAQSSLETEVAAVGAFYFVDSQSGNDAQAGTSTDRPWRTLERLGSVKLQPGDSVFLRRGSTWRGTFRPAQSGSPGRPIRIAAYGEGPRPVVDGGPQNAVLLENVQHWSVEGLELTNDRGSGQDVLRARSSKKSSRDSSIAVLDCLVRDGGGSGIHVGENEEGNFDNVVVEGCRAVSNKVSGIFVQGSYFDRVAGVTIRKCVARGNGADGIKIYNARKGLIEECLAEGNGWNEDARVGIWCWNSDDVLIQLCESFGNRTPGTQDGGGFDIDWACSNCVIQHCYSHDNEGAGYLLMGAGDPGQTTTSSVRFNISRNDGLKNSYGGIVCYGNLASSRVHNNLVHVQSGTSGPAIQIRGDASGGFPRGVSIFNNLVVADESGVALSVPDKGRENEFNHNGYHAPKGLTWAWAGTSYSEISALRAASGQESKGWSADPALRGGAAPSSRFTVTCYELRDTSPAIDAGTEWREELGARDYAGTPLGRRRQLSVGPLQPKPTETSKDDGR